MASKRGSFVAEEFSQIVTGMFRTVKCGMANAWFLRSRAVRDLRVLTDHVEGGMM